MLKSILLIISSVMVLLSGCSCENNVREGNRAMVPNPFVSVDSVELAAEGAGFVFYCPSEVEGYSKKDISYIKNKLIQVVFRDGNKSILLRKAKGTDDISGDYNKYNNIDNQQVKAYSVTMKGRGDGYYVSSWSYGCFSFAVDPVNPKPRLVDPDKGGGAMFDLGVYTVEMASFYARALPIGYSGFNTSYCYGTDASSVLALKYPNDILATLRMGIVCETSSTMTIFGTKGKIEIPGFCSANDVYLFNNDSSAFIEDYHATCDQPQGFTWQIEAVKEYGLDPAEMYDDYVIVPGNRVPFTLTFADDAAIYVQLPEENSVKRQRSVDEFLAFLDKYDSSEEHGVFMKVITDKDGKAAFIYEPYRP